MKQKTLEAHLYECLKTGNTKKALYIVWLLKDNVDRYYDGKSLLLLAKEFENAEVYSALKEKGAVEKLSDEAIKALNIDLVNAIVKNDLKEIERLILLGIDVNSNITYYKQTPLVVACMYGNLEAVELLIEKGADVNFSGTNDWKPIFSAVNAGAHRVVECLLKNGANIDEKDKDGHTPLILASNLGNLEIVKILLDRGVDVNVKSNNGQTALSYAVNVTNPSKDRLEIIKLLIEAGVDVNLKSSGGKSPLDLIICSEVRRLVSREVRKKQNKENVSGLIDRAKMFFGKDKE